MKPLSFNALLPGPLRIAKNATEDEMRKGLEKLAVAVSLNPFLLGAREIVELRGAMFAMGIQKGALLRSPH